MILDRTADVFRLLPDPDDPDHEYLQPVYRGIRIQVQPENERYQALTGSTYGRTYRGYLTQSGLQPRDKIAVSGTLTASGMEYVVEGVADWNFPPLPHYELKLAEAGI